MRKPDRDGNLKFSMLILLNIISMSLSIIRNGMIKGSILIKELTLIKSPNEEQFIGRQI